MMDKIKLKSFAKVNLGLNVKEKRPDGYHNIESIMHCISIYDTLTFQKDNDIELSSNIPYIPTDNRNIVYKMILALRKAMQTDKIGAKINIAKYIPVAAGLGGGSSNGAATIVALNELYSLGLSVGEMRNIALSVGADIPFLIHGESAFCKGVGELITPLDTCFDYDLVLVKPNFGVSTQLAYEALDSANRMKTVDFDCLKTSLQNRDFATIKENLQNDFELVVSPKHRKIKEIKDSFHLGFATQMSGSGPTVFGLYEDCSKAKEEYEELKKHYTQCYLAKLKNKSIELL